MKKKDQVESERSCPTRKDPAHVRDRDRDQPKVNRVQDPDQDQVPERVVHVPDPSLAPERVPDQDQDRLPGQDRVQTVDQENPDHVQDQDLEKVGLVQGLDPEKANQDLVLDLDQDLVPGPGPDTVNPGRGLNPKVVRVPDQDPGKADLVPDRDLENRDLAQNQDLENPDLVQDQDRGKVDLVQDLDRDLVPRKVDLVRDLDRPNSNLLVKTLCIILQRLSLVIGIKIKVKWETIVRFTF